MPGANASGEQATIGKSLVVKGELSGSESLYIDGKVEGAITLPGNRVTIGRNGQVAANISAREIVVLGKVRAKGWRFYTFDNGATRFMCGWDADPAQIDAFAADLREAAFARAA